MQFLTLIVTTVRSGMPFRLLLEPLAIPRWMWGAPHRLSHEDHHTSVFILAWVCMYSKQEWKTKPGDSQQWVLTPGKRSCWGGTAMTSLHVFCVHQADCFHALIYGSITWPFPWRSKVHACPLSRAETQVLVCDPSSSPGELAWQVACHKFSLGLGGNRSGRDKSTPDYLVIFTLGLISGCNRSCSAARRV